MFISTFPPLFASWTDLIVGAPNFFDRKAEIGGAVYVYLNPFGHWDDQARPIRLNGTYDSMFGMTVSNVGDLDQDGYGGTRKTFLLTQNVLILKGNFCCVESLLYQTVVYGLNHYNKNVVLETSLSDIYTDIAVGAPFDGDGKVFIYRGSKSGIETKPAQVSLLWI